MAPLLRLLDPAAATEVAVAVGHVLVRLSEFLHAAEDVTAREIPLGVTEIFPCHAEILSGGTGATVVVAVVMVTMMTMVAMMAVVVVMIVIEQITQETSEKTSCEAQTWKHSILHCR